MSNCATKTNLEGAAGADTSSLAAKSDLVTILADLNKLSNVLDNDVVKKTVFDQLVTKVYSIKVSNTSGLDTKTWYDSDKQNLEKERLKMLIRKYQYKWAVPGN